MPRDRRTGMIDLKAARAWLKERRAPAPPTLAAARLRRLVAEGHLMEMRARATAASLVDVKEAAAAWNAHVRHVRAVCLQLPATLAPAVAAESDVLMVQKILDTAIRRTLVELSEYKHEGGT
jgi:hypothetical protein